jgi:putative phosphoribosyl transferase
METLREAMTARAASFANREAAGERLAESLLCYQGEDPLILGIPRGGVPVAATVARRLGAELDVVVARKLGAPAQPELAMGAVTADGGLYIDEQLRAELGVTEDQLTAAIARETAEAKARERRFRGERPAPCIANRTVIVVDDGLATGATMRAAVHAVRKQRPARLVVAVPVGSAHARDVLQHEADDVICLAAPEPFWAVGLYYDDFQPVTDETVQRILQAVPTGARPLPTRANLAAT